MQSGEGEEGEGKRVKTREGRGKRGGKEAKRGRGWDDVRDRGGEDEGEMVSSGVHAALK